MTEDDIISPTHERMAKDPMSLSATDAHKDVTWRLDAECELDRLFQSGILGNDEVSAKRRYSAGMWLRQLYIGLYASEGIGCYSKDRITDTGEMSDQQSRNFKTYLDTQRAVPKYWRVLFTVCCESKKYPRVYAIHDALDELARHRGIS